MSTFHAFEEIEAWQKARLLVGEIYRITARGEFGRDFGLRDQTRRAAVSVMSNIAEGAERGGAREFRQFLSVAKGSIAEVRSHLYVAYDQGYVKTEDLESIKATALEIARMLAGLMSYLKSTERTGVKYSKGSRETKP